MHSLLVITGVTASGKTARAVDAARALDGEIISADSRQVYRGMDIGTGKDLSEYGDVPVHMLDIVPAGYRYNLFEYLRDYHRVHDEITARGKLPIVCGGTGLYVESILNGLQLPPVPANPALRESLQGKSLAELTEILARLKSLHNDTDTDTAQRAIRAIEIAQYYLDHPDEATLTTPHPVEDAVIVATDISRDERRARITRRLHDRLEQGMVQEIRTLLDGGIAPDDLMYYGLEYRYITSYVIGQIGYDEMVSSLEIAIHQFAKRQMTWFRGMERRGFKIHWLPYDLPKADFTERICLLMNS